MLLPAIAEKADFALGSQHSLHTLIVKGRSKFPYPVSANSILPFLLHHKRTLKHVDFGHIIFYHASTNGFMEGNAGFVTTGAGMRTVLEVLRDELSLESARVLLRRLGCDEQCRLETDGEHNAACGAYPASDSWVNVKELDDLATDMKVPLKDGSWDFGEVALRPSLSLMRSARSL